LPSEAVRAAKEQGVSPDVMYALSLLKQTGICVVPASGFGHKEGRFGFRTTFLPSEEDVKRAIHDIEIHHKTFCSKYKNE
jgi:aspartate/methionine/tyrosine aminotransferase